MRSSGVAVLIFVALTILACRPAAKDSAESRLPKGPPDSPTPQVSITSPSEGAVLQGDSILVRIQTRDFEFAYDSATTPGTMTEPPAQYAMVPQVPNAGHVHVYLARYPQAQDVTPAKFFMVQEFQMPDQAEFLLRGVEPGTYRLLIELVTHDHTSRIKHHPTDWPSLDMITITVQ